MAFKETGFNLLLIKIVALLSFFGGPALLVDRLKITLGVNAAFILCFLPVALMILGVLYMAEEAPGPVDKFLVRLGSCNAWVVLAVQLWGGWILFYAPERPDHTFYVTGVLVGTVSSIGYAYSARQWLQRAVESEDRPRIPPEYL